MDAELHMGKRVLGERAIVERRALSSTSTRRTPMPIHRLMLSIILAAAVLVACGGAPAVQRNGNVPVATGASGAVPTPETVPIVARAPIGGAAPTVTISSAAPTPVAATAQLAAPALAIPTSTATLRFIGH